MDLTYEYNHLSLHGSLGRKCLRVPTHKPGDHGAELELAFLGLGTSFCSIARPLGIAQESRNIWAVHLHCEEDDQTQCWPLGSSEASGQGSGTRGAQSIGILPRDLRELSWAGL